MAVATINTPIVAIRIMTPAPASSHQKGTRALLPEVSADTALLAYRLAYIGLIVGAALVLISTLVAFWSDSELKRHDNLRLSANERATAEANARTKEAELRLAELRERVARPRHLNQAVFLEEIKGIPPTPVEITLRSGDPDSHWLAFSIVGALEKAGWPWLQSGTSFQMFGLTPEPIAACAGNLGGVRVLSKSLSTDDIANLQAPPPRPKGTSPLTGLSDVLWQAVGENEVGFATCPYLPEGQLHVVVAPRWAILPETHAPASDPNDAATAPTNNAK
jgi:hypothetical protein